jgi:hypothetical protein
MPAAEPPSALDQLDPAPAERRRPDPPAPPRRPRQQRPRKVEPSVVGELKTMPEVMRKSAIAATALLLARELDTLDMTARDTAGHARELRMAMTTLHEMAPGERKGDDTDEVRARRERRLAAAAPE